MIKDGIDESGNKMKSEDIERMKNRIAVHKVRIDKKKD